MKMWHKLLLIIACLALLAFSACGEKAPAPPKKKNRRMLRRRLYYRRMN